MRIGTTQLVPHNLGDKDWHLDRMFGYIKQGQDAGLDLLCFPEYELTGFMVEDPSIERMCALSEQADGPAAARVRAALKGSNMAVGYGFVENDAGALYNSYIILDKDGQKHLYRKTHLVEFGENLHEKNFVRPGHALSTFSLNGVVFGVVICYDGFHCETMRVLVLQGAQVILWPLAGFGPGTTLTTKTAQIRAFENNAFVVVSALTGNYAYSNEQRTVHFDSGAGVYDPELLASGPRVLLDIDKEGLVWSELGDDELNACGFHQGWLYQERRPELYQSIGQKQDPCPPREA